MTTITRDPWADATVAATQEHLEGDLAGLRRRIALRRILWIVLGGVGLLAALALTDPNAAQLWTLRSRTLSSTYSLVGLAGLLMVVGYVRTAGNAQPFVEPSDFLPSADRAWLRTQVAEGRAVPEERRAVVAGAARRMVVEGKGVTIYLGIVVLWIGTVVNGASLGVLITFSVLIVCTLVRVVRDLVRARRAGRWLSQNG